MRPEKYQDVEDHLPTRPHSLVMPDALDPGFASLREELSRRVLGHLGAEVWRELFLGPAHDTIRFRRASLTLLLADSPLAGIEREEGRLLAQRLGADSEISSSVEIAMSFREPSAALRAAMVVQRLASGRQVRASLTTGRCMVAAFQLAGMPRQLVIGPEVERAEDQLLATPPGSIVVAAESHALVVDHLAREVQDAIVATELEGDRVTRASITFAPRRSAASSTFVGLGLV